MLVSIFLCSFTKFKDNYIPSRQKKILLPLVTSNNNYSSSTRTKKFNPKVAPREFPLETSTWQFLDTKHGRDRHAKLAN